MSDTTPLVLTEKSGEESVCTADPSDTPDPQISTTADAPAGDPPQPAPSVDVKMDETLSEYVHRILDRADEVNEDREIAEKIGELIAGKALSEMAAELLGPVGAVIDVAVMLCAVAEAFGTGRRLQEQQGFCYGLMWETYGMPNGKKAFIDWAGDSADELRQAFFDGVAQGREKAQTVRVHNAIKLNVSYYMATGLGNDAGIVIKAQYDSGDRLGAGQEMVLNDLWKKFRENELGKDWLNWPDPEDMQP